MDAIYRSAVNCDVRPAASSEFGPLRIGPLSVWPPVVLAPMVGVTNYPFRKLCRRFGAALCVGEMLTARPFAEGNKKTLELVRFGPDETLRSLQLYGVDPYYIGEAVKGLVGEHGVEHLDLNFGCSVPKVTRKGGGAAVPLKPTRLRDLLRAAVRNAGSVPVTAKFRIGIDDEHPTFALAGRIAEDEGCSAVCLHARTAEQLYRGRARWEVVGELKQAVERIPVIGNGDVWEAEDALRMMRSTGCDGVAVARGCLGRPWLFRDLVDVFQGREPSNPPVFGEVLDLLVEHAQLLAQWLGEAPAMRAFRQHSAWYTKGFRGSARLRQRLMRVSSLRELDDVLARADRAEPFPPSAMRVPRAKTGRAQRVALPAGYLDSQ